MVEGGISVTTGGKGECSALLGEGTALTIWGIYCFSLGTTGRKRKKHGCSFFFF